MHKVGTPSANSSVSETNATSAFNFCRMLLNVFRNGFAANLLFAFNQELQIDRQLPFTARNASTALMCMYIWPLSSQAPRA